MKSASVTLELPFPPKELSPNARVHWRKKAAVTADYREDCAWHAVYGRFRGAEKMMSSRLKARVRPMPKEPLEPPVRAVVAFVVPNRRRRDLDNLLASLKAAWDGLVDAGVLEGDDTARFSVECSGTCYEKGKSYVAVSLTSGAYGEAQ